MAAAPDPGPSHVCFVVHGLTATTSDVRHIAAALSRAHGPTLAVVPARANEGPLYSLFSTQRGVADGGARLAAEVKAYLRAHSSVTRVSFAAHSLGGLYVRAAAHELPPHVELVNFLSFATPHAGVRGHVGLGLFDPLILRGLLGQTGRDLLLAPAAAAQANDAAAPIASANSGPLSPFSSFAALLAPAPILDRLSDGLHLNALRRFKHRVVIAAESEVLVPLSSAALVESTERLDQLASEGRHARLHFHHERRADDMVPLPMGGNSASGELIPMGNYIHVRRVYSQVTTAPGAGWAGPSEASPSSSTSSSSPPSSSALASAYAHGGGLIMSSPATAIAELAPVSPVAVRQRRHSRSSAPSSRADEEEGLFGLHSEEGNSSACASASASSGSSAALGDAGKALVADTAVAATSFATSPPSRLAAALSSLWPQGRAHVPLPPLPQSPTAEPAARPALLYSQEHRIIRQLRESMSWSTVLVSFAEFPGRGLFDHWRIVVSRPYLEPGLGHDVLDFAARHCFEH